MTKKDFVHLHLHTEYSILNGGCKIKNLIESVKNLNQKAVAITDISNMYGVINFYKQAIDNDIKPIIGCEIYVSSHSLNDKFSKFDNNADSLVLLCENEIGYKNLIKLVSYSFIKGFYDKPRVDIDLLKENSEGLIALSSSFDGKIYKSLINGFFEDALITAQIYKEIFLKNNFFLEIFNHGLDKQKTYIEQIVKISQDLDIPLVATNDVYYLKKDDSIIHDVLLSIQNNTIIIDDFEINTNEKYLKSTEEMYNIFSEYKEALLNTVKIADRCNLSFEFDRMKLPSFFMDGVEDNFLFFKEKCYKGFYKLYGKDCEKYILDRLEMEISIIKDMGYVDYFLIVWDFIKFAKDKKIPVGPGRGSGSGSICAYCIGITGIDPIKYNLIFERFLNIERISMPDFDVDFCYERRQEVIDYVINKYGSDHVSQIITFGTMSAKAVVRDVARVMDMPYSLADKIAKSIPNQLNITLNEALKTKEFLSFYKNDAKVKKVVDMAMRLEGMPRHTSVHAAGVVITKDKVSDYVPLQLNDGQVVTQYTMSNLEKLGLLKMDFLGLRTLTVIDNTVKLINKYNKDFDIEKIDLNDKDVYNMLSKGYSLGVFQYESIGMKKVLKKLKPESIEDLIALVSLYRPGPMKSIDKFIENRHNRQNIRYLHPKLENILNVTYGCIVYQEQVMDICRSLAGYTYGQADIVRRAMSKKNVNVMKKEKQHFISGCLKNGITEDISNIVFDDISDFASYAFNKSHAASYSILSYRTAFLKCHYKKEFFCSLLSSVIDNTKKIEEYIIECKRCNINVIRPDINLSEVNFIIKNNSIVSSFLIIKGIGKNFSKQIVLEREKNGDFKSFYDFLYRMEDKDLNKKNLENLIKSGSMDCFENRRTMLENIDDLFSFITNKKHNKIIGQFDLFDQNNNESSYEIKKYEEFDLNTVKKFEIESLGVNIFFHPLNNYEEYIKKFSNITIYDIFSGVINGNIKETYRIKMVVLLNDVKITKTFKNEDIAFLTIDDRTAKCKAVVFNSILKSVNDIIKQDEILYIEGNISLKNPEEPSIIIDKVINTIDLYNKSHKKNKLFIKISSMNSTQYNDIINIISVFKGFTPVYLYLEDQKKYIKMHEKYNVNFCDTLRLHLNSLVNEENVILKTIE